ncbi:hypothetical protein [Acinetobacter nematophilus]|uniref:Uncharacterized protein n=1 Tax=Acinetobacter nematophilus TaxID=2994642 RepID=A0A9X3DU34_9GAMM|nr:hypothetical protein [Acinetobacter nematophilus]MCX5468529.1 hypothetical protein [Acinetobacter nematophilus]
MFTPAMNETKMHQNQSQYFSIEQLKRFLKRQIRLKADQGELFVSECLAKDFARHELEKLSDEFKKAGYKVKLKIIGEEKIFSVFWN